MPRPIDYPIDIVSDRQKLSAVYSVSEKFRLEHNRMGEIANSNLPQYQKRWNAYTRKFKVLYVPLLQEQNRLRTNLIWARYTPEEWSAIKLEDKIAAAEVLWGNKQEEKERPTKAISESLDVLKNTVLLAPIEVADPYENFSGYTEVDEDSDITITSTKIDVSSMRVDAVSYVYKDYGAGNFGNTSHAFTFYVDGFSGGTVGTAGIYSIGNSYGTILQHLAVDNNSIGIYVQEINGTGTFYTVCADWVDDSIDYNDQTAEDTLYYPVAERSGTTFTVYIYDDSNRTNLFDTITTPCSNTTYRYLQGMFSKGDTEGFTDSTTCYVENLDISYSPTSLVPSSTAPLIMQGVI